MAEAITKGVKGASSRRSVPSSTGSPGAARSAPARLHLRIPLSSFVGREAEKSQLAALLQDHRLVTVTGPAGIGKTRLAVEVASEVSGGYPGGAAVAELAPVNQGGGVWAAIALALSVAEEPSTPLAETLAGRFRRQKVLLILDTCEHVVSECSGAAETLLEACPQMAIVATSQEPLAVAGEAVFALSPMRMPPADEADVDDIQSSEAVKLFCERAAAAHPGFSLDAEKSQAVADICRRLDGIPLAIELAAARTGMLSCRQIAARLDRRFSILTGGARSAPARHRSLEAALSWTYDLLSDPQRELLERLSVFPAGFGLQAAEQVCGYSQIAPEDVFELLAELVSKSLVTAEIVRGEGRYRLLETIRQFVREQRSKKGGDEDLEGRLAEWCTGLCEFAESFLAGPRQREWLDRLDLERDNIAGALQWMFSTGGNEAALRLCGALGLFWWMRGYFSEGRRQLKRALAEATEAPPAHVCKAAWGTALLSAMQGHVDEAISSAQRSLALARQIDDRGAVARALGALGFATMQSDAGDAIAILEEAAATAREVADDWCLADALSNLGNAHMRLGDTGPARRFFKQALEVAGPRGDRQSRIRALTGLGQAAIVEGQWNQGEVLLGQALAISRELGSRKQTADILIFLGDARRARNDYQRAREYLDEALAVGRDLESPLLVARCLGAMGRLVLAQGNPETASELLEQAISKARQAGVDFVVVRLLASLGWARHSMGNLAGAEEAYREGMALAEGIGDKEGIVMLVQLGLGALAHLKGNDDLAMSLHHKALAVGAEMGNKDLIARSLAALARLSGRQGRHEYAARLFGIVHAMAEARLRSETPAQWMDGYQADINRVNQALGEEEFDRLFSEGTALSVDEAVGYARRGRGARKRPTVGWEALTETEAQVVELVAEGLTSRQIADRLFVSPRTVSTHLTHIFAKLGLTSRAHLAREALRREGRPDTI